MIVETFTKPLLDWFEKFGRKDLPWQHPRDAYRVWISEIMLQQTQVKTVIPYFNRFLDRFPDVYTLAESSMDDVLVFWSGLGYYSRARNLYKTSVILVNTYKGIFPDTLDELIALPGIGASTAAAIASLAFDQPTAILDGNVKRVLSRYFMVDGPRNHSVTIRKLWQLADSCMSKEFCAQYTQAIMDLGATCCTTKRPTCEICPLQRTCLAKASNLVADYPQKNPKKTIPTRHQQFLLLFNADQIYLEQRPPVGLWGGLWCLPTIEINDCPKTYVENTYEMDVLSIEELLKMKHSFTHFHLEITALTIRTNLPTKQLKEIPGGWFKLTETHHLGLAKPIQMILEKFKNTLP